MRDRLWQRACGRYIRDVDARVRFARSCVALCVATTMSACSMMLSAGPTSTPSVCGDPPTSLNPAPPIIDTVMAGGVVLGTAVYVANRGLGPRDALMDPPVDLLLLSAAVFALSAAQGFAVVSHCRSLERQYAAPIDCA